MKSNSPNPLEGARLVCLGATLKFAPAGSPKFRYKDASGMERVDLAAIFNHEANSAQLATLSATDCLDDFPALKVIVAQPNWKLLPMWEQSDALKKLRDTLSRLLDLQNKITVLQPPS